MPYIENGRRKELDKVVKLMNIKGVIADGDLNYILYKFCIRHIHPSYNSYKNFIGELNECVAEIRRRLLTPYEEKKKLENGDVK